MRTVECSISWRRAIGCRTMECSIYPRGGPGAENWGVFYILDEGQGECSTVQYILEEGQAVRTGECSIS